jgi:glycosyltransferase involved in cell wall biosynthesis
MTNQQPFSSSAASTTFPEVLVCLSHLRWDFVYQRPQHLLSRMAERIRIYFVEEPIFDSAEPHYTYTKKEDNLIVAVPHLPEGTSNDQSISIQQALLDELTAEMDMNKTALWYYTPMALKFSRHLQPVLTVFDCMDELSAFKFAPQELKDLEAELLEKADVVFTGGASLYAAKEHRHKNVHLFPSSIDSKHFGQARQAMVEPQDQQGIPHPRLGFFGVIDERFDIQLIRDAAAAQPDWHFVLVGPVVKIDPATLPQAANIHYTGGRSYQELPAYLAGWDIALIPFALNESTRFISPTKTPEYLAAGIPVISTPIRDVVNPYGEQKLVHIAANAEELIAAGQTILNNTADRASWLTAVDAFLEGNSWDTTCAAMQQLMGKAVVANTTVATIKHKQPA